ncbi:PDZ domain-containing protein [Lactobacillus sp. PV037]|uniref:S41 family peptidase n=1 Tax=unclassified Lactobacillus TaxID=2620435 RepID=UPI002240DF73|nr:MULTISPECIES: S41 family peptidase [unclassified Lactobacillus]QNQ82354.1 PDZ domain-containing protein [Lactobacillus sp. PV012]QNQ83533.1 PDZ domain-containing protein [Lactobacillus sp. PV037]
MEKSDHKDKKQTKKKIPKPIKYLLTGVGGIIIGAAGTFGVMRYQELSSPLATVDRVYQQLQASYYQKISSSQLAQGAIDGMLASLKDPYSQTLSGQTQQQVNSVIQGESFSGVGIQMKVSGNKILVDSIVSDSPASKSRIKVNDQLIKVNNAPVSAKNFDKVAQLVRGKTGTKVRLTLKRGSQTFEVVLTRAKINQSSLTVKNEKNATIITISQFDTNTAKDLKAALKNINFKEYPKLIIDLQNNPGGVMESALTSAAYFVPNGKTLMKYESKTEKQTIKSSNKLADNFKVKVKPIILINKNTASASEIFTAALVENKRAITVGQTSYGKGTVQQVGSTAGTEYKYTIAKWLTPNGTWINHQGIKPMYKTPVSKFEDLPAFQTSDTLKEKMIGLDVTILQQYLRVLGYLDQYPTGVFDSNTKAAVMAYQKSQGIKETGKVDAQLKQQLYLTVAQKAAEDNPALKKALSLKG